MGNYWSFLRNYVNGLRAALANRLAANYYEKFERTGLLEHIDDAIWATGRAVHLTSNENPVYLNNLGLTLMRRFKSTGSIEDLDRAIEKNEQAVESIAVDHPDRALTIWELHCRVGLRGQGLSRTLIERLRRRNKQLNSSQ
jgi:hypothetical protein